MGTPNEQAKHEFRAITDASEEEINEKPIRWGLLADLVPNKKFNDELGGSVSLFFLCFPNLFVFSLTLNNYYVLMF